jgi:hypothetical protein
VRPFVDTKTGEEDEKEDRTVAEEDRIKAHDRSLVARFG